MAEREHLDGQPVSVSTYSNHGCHCDGCTAAQRVYARRYRKRYPEKEAQRLEHARDMRRLGLWL
jgi:hypothetical protein